MKICLSCRRASPRRSVYCQGCSRTFGSKICANKHPNAPSPQVQFCATCGSPEMTEPTRYLNLSWAAPLLSGLTALFLWRWGLAHLSLLGGLFWRVVLTAVSVLLCTTPCRLLGGAYRTLSWVLILWGLGWMLAILPGKGGALGKWLRALPPTVAGLALGFGRTALRALGRVLFRAIWPVKPKGGESGSPPRGPRD